MTTRKTFPLLVLLLGSAFLNGCIPIIIPYVVESHGRFEGLVLDQRTDQPVVGATVSCCADNDPTDTTQTKIDGRFCFEKRDILTLVFLGPNNRGFYTVVNLTVKAKGYWESGVGIGRYGGVVGDVRTGKDGIVFRMIPLSEKPPQRLRDWPSREPTSQPSTCPNTRR